MNHMQMESIWFWIPSVTKNIWVQTKVVDENDYQPEEFLDELVEENHTLKISYQGVIQAQIFIAQSTIEHRDLRTQIQIFWNLCNNLSFKEDSLYLFAKSLQAK